METRSRASNPKKKPAQKNSVKVFDGRDHRAWRSPDFKVTVHKEMTTQGQHPIQRLLEKCNVTYQMSGVDAPFYQLQIPNGPDNRNYVVVYLSGMGTGVELLRMSNYHLALFDITSSGLRDGGRNYFYLGVGLLSDAHIQRRLEEFRIHWASFKLAPYVQTGEILPLSAVRRLWITATMLLYLAKPGQIQDDYARCVKFLGPKNLSIRDARQLVKDNGLQGADSAFRNLGRAHAWPVDNSSSMRSKVVGRASLRMAA